MSLSKVFKNKNSKRRNHRIISLSIFLICISTRFASAQWTQIANLSGSVVQALAVNGNDVYAGTYNGGIFRSINVGNWIQINSGLNNNLNVAALAVNSSRIFAGTFSGGVFYSTNNGDNWIQSNSGLGSINIRAFAVRGSDIYLGQYLAGVFRSTNDGLNWTRYGLGEGDLLYSLLATSSGFFVGTYGAVFRTTNNGTNWNILLNGLTNNHIRALANIGTNLFAGTHGGVFLSANNGDLWMQVNSGLTDTYVQTLVAVGSNLFAGTDGSGIFMTTNNGISWNSINAGLTDTNVYCTAVSNTHLFAGTYEGKVWKRPLSEIITGINEENEVPSQYVLDQNFPNPFNPSTTIKFRIPRKSFATLRIFDVMGKEVSNLISKDLISGEHSLQWNAEDLPSGIYFYKLETESFTDTKKLILIR